ncbi:MAG TPA: proton-conducting transporter membrane subunit, partial [Anaerolineae bacterium]|nr:proton-conducting transporter membrane subunit [Anaerolineae bacterium]
GAAILAVAFLAKAGAWPLNFWLPPAYAAASAPAAAVFAVLYLRDRSQFWPLIPAGVLAVVGFGVSPLATSAWFLFPALLIVAGVLLVVRTLFRRT